MRTPFGYLYKNFRNRIIAALFCSFFALVLFVLVAGRGSMNVFLAPESDYYQNDGWFYQNRYGHRFPVGTLPVKIPAPNGEATLYHELNPSVSCNSYLCFFSEHQNITVSVNGSVIYRFNARATPRWLITYRALYHIVRLPSDIAEGALLAIESTALVREYAGEFNPVLIGSRVSILKALVGERWSYFVLGITMIVTALFLLGTGVLFMRGTKDFTMLHLAFLTLCIGLWQLEESRLLQLFFGYLPLHWALLYATQLFMPLLTFLFLTSINENRMDVVTEINFWAIVVVLLVQLGLQITGIAALTSTIFLSYALYVFMCVHSLVLISHRPWLKRSPLRYLFYVTMACSVGIFCFTFVSFLLGTFSGLVLSIGLAFAFISMILLTYHKELQFFQQASQAEVYKELAFVDVATGAKSKTAWFSFVDSFGAQSPQGEYALILFDMNNLKTLNDDWGHVVGDRVIKAFAYCLMEAVGEKGSVYRIGGDEFICLCYQQPREKVATIISEFDKIVECQKDSDHPFSAAYGFTFFTPHLPRDFQSAIDAADEKMYEKKQRMKGRCSREQHVAKLEPL
ncbi:MAG: diguanylate cyclase [Treponema sp.]|nr:diguanylate cyclase [Treponema sp.]